MGTSLVKPGDKAVLRADRNHLIRCRFGARFAGLQYTRWTGKKFESEEKQIGEDEIEIFNDTGRDATLSLVFKDPADDGDVRVTPLSGFLAADAEPSRPEEPAYAMVLLPEEVEALSAAQASRAPINGGGVLTVRIFLEIEGFGSFTAGVLDTSKGISSAWVGAGVTLPLTATPAAGWQFSHWLVNGLFGGTSPKHFVAARPLLKIRAVFAKAAPKAMAPSEAA